MPGHTKKERAKRKVKPSSKSGLFSRAEVRKAVKKTKKRNR